MLRIEREQPRIELREAGPAVRAGALGRENAGSGVGIGLGSHVNHAASVLQCYIQLFAQRGFASGADRKCSHRQFDVVLDEAVEARPLLRRDQTAVDAQVREALTPRPLGERGIQALARHNQWRQQGNALAAIFCEQAARDGIDRLRFNARVAFRTILRPQLDEQQAQKVIDLGERRDRALVPSAAGALLDRHRGRDAEYGVDVGARSGLHELPRVSVQRFKIAALALGKQNIECQRALAAARNAGNDRESIEVQVHIDIFEIVLPGAANLDGGGRHCAARRRVCIGRCA